MPNTTNCFQVQENLKKWKEQLDAKLSQAESDLESRKRKFYDLIQTTETGEKDEKSKNSSINSKVESNSKETAEKVQTALCHG
jgi:hypothetical protein